MDFGPVAGLNAESPEVLGSFDLYFYCRWVKVINCQLDVVVREGVKCGWGLTGFRPTGI